MLEILKTFILMLFVAFMYALMVAIIVGIPLVAIAFMIKGIFF